MYFLYLKIVTQVREGIFVFTKNCWGWKNFRGEKHIFDWWLNGEKLIGNFHGILEEFEEYGKVREPVNLLLWWLSGGVVVVVVVVVLVVAEEGKI